jgi:hypothetical protein
MMTIHINNLFLPTKHNILKTEIITSEKEISKISTFVHTAALTSLVIFSVLQLIKHCVEVFKLLFPN